MLSGDRRGIRRTVVPVSPATAPLIAAAVTVVTISRADRTAAEPAAVSVEFKRSNVVYSPYGQ